MPGSTTRFGLTQVLGLLARTFPNGSLIQMSYRSVLLFSICCFLLLGCNVPEKAKGSIKIQPIQFYRIGERWLLHCEKYGKPTFNAEAMQIQLFAGGTWEILPFPSGNPPTSRPQVYQQAPGDTCEVMTFQQALTD